MAKSFKGKTAYNKNSERYLNTMKHLAIYLGSTNIPNSIVDNQSFNLLSRCSIAGT